MFPKAAAIFQVDPARLSSLTEEQLEKFSYVPCLAHEAISQGFSPVQDVFKYDYMGFALMRLTVQKKTVPASAVKARTKEMAVASEETNGHWPGRKLMKELKDRAIDELIARAIPTTKAHDIFVNNKTGMIVIASTSNAVTGVINSLLYQAAEIQLEMMKMPGSKVLTSWLAGQDIDDLPRKLTIDDTVIFEHPGEGGKTVKYERSSLDDDDVLANIDAGATVQALALTFDDKVSFKLKDGLLGGIKVQGVLDEKYTGPKEDAFQNAFYLAAVEMAALATYLNEVA